MLKDILATYGAIRMLEDAGRRSSSPPPNKDDDSVSAIVGCGCFIIVLILILGSCAGCMLIST